MSIQNKANKVLLNEAEIRAHLSAQDIIITILDTVDSTNDYLKTRAKHDNAIQVCLAEAQTHGRGRLNRRWHSPCGQNIYCSLRYTFRKKIADLSGLSLITGLAACKAIEQTTQLKNCFFVKWPNDIMSNQEKLGGILIETQSISNTDCVVIIGIGINVNMQHANTDSIDQPWSSLRKITQQNQDRNILAAQLINHLITYCLHFEEAGLSHFMAEWAQKDYLFGKPIQLTSANKTSHGICAGINIQGHLLLTMPDNTIQAYASGEAAFHVE